jgi:NAD(P)-dependent dehydrogenase (short-subunit alcohol dehydrogenase family)
MQATSDMSDRICLVTGATNGIGLATTRELGRMGAAVVLVGRSEEKARHAAEEIKAAGGQHVDSLIGDLSLMSEVRRVAEEFRRRYDRLHVLVNNAGAIFTRYHETAEGLEATFALNHLSYFLLTNLLLDRIEAAGEPERRARVVNVTSGAHRAARLDFDALQLGPRNYKAMLAYSQSKLMNIMFTYELARRLEERNAPVTANTVHPGFVASGFGRNNGDVVSFILNLLKPFAQSPEKGAQTAIYLASSPEVEDVSGRYFEKCRPKASSRASLDEAGQSRLWEISAELAGLQMAVEA